MDLFVLCVAYLTVFVNCLVKQFVLCLGVVFILLLNVMEVFSMGQTPETTKNMLQCPSLAHPYTLDDLRKFNEKARKCVDKWKNAVW